MKQLRYFPFCVICKETIRSSSRVDHSLGYSTVENLKKSRLWADVKVEHADFPTRIKVVRRVGSKDA